MAELLVSAIVASDRANLSLVLGVGAITVPLLVDVRTVRQEATLTLGAAIVFAGVVQGDGITALEGGLLLVLPIGGLVIAAPIAVATVSLKAMVATRTGHTVTKGEGVFVVFANAAIVPFLA